MTPAEKMDEIVRALEKDDVAKRLSRALALAIELRDSAELVWISGEIAPAGAPEHAWETRFVECYEPDHGGTSALLILSDPTP